jgi:hypothetical protein
MTMGGGGITTRLANGDAEVTVHNKGNVGVLKSVGKKVTNKIVL